MNQLMRASVRIACFRSQLSKQFPSIQCAHYSKATEPNIDPVPFDVNKPLPYMGSPAQSYRGEDSRRGGKAYDWPSYQPYVINGSIAIFLIYFTILREENDIDQKLGANLNEHVPGVEIMLLRDTYAQQKKSGLPTDETAKRLKELGVSLDPIANE